MPRRRCHSSSERIDRSKKAVNGGGWRERAGRWGSSSVVEPKALSAALGTSGGVKREELPENIYEEIRLDTFSSCPTASSGFLLA